MKNTVLLIVLLILNGSSFGQITANGNTGTSTTAYTSGASNDPIFIWCSPGLATAAGSLTATPAGGVGPYTFEWYYHNQATSSWTSYSTQTGATSTLTNLVSDGYRVEIFDNLGALVACDIAWVWNMNGNVTATNTPTACNATNLVGTVAANNFAYYNPPPAESLINASTQITVCFNATHTWVSDLAFYLVGPASCGSPTVLLSPNPGALGQNSVCNDGNNVTNLCFTTTPAANLNVCSPSPATLSGTYSSYGPSSTPINWSPIIGCNAAQGGWRVQIYDCIGQDLGALTNASISFSNLTSVCSSPTSITYNSGAINSPINDNSCSAILASIFQVPVPTNLSTPITLTPTVTYLWTASPAFTIPNPTSSLTSSLTGLPIGTTDFNLTATVSYGGTSCTYPATTSITVSPSVPSTFDQIPPICSGGSFTLPTTSTNGFTGTWSPAINNTTTTTYTFTPGGTQCGTSATMTVVVNPIVSPTFTQVPAICAGQALAALPNTSDNGITGTWSPALNNTTTTLYTFTPDAGQCASTATMTITVNPNVTPTFTQVAPICQGGVLNPLPTVSNNALVGTWSPAVNNIATTLYTFTVSAAGCFTTAEMTIVVNSSVTPTFTQVDPICEGETLTALPTTSLNGVNGAWSPALDNTTTTTYNFAPNAGQCANAVSMTIDVNQLAEPTFLAVNPICSGEFLSPLPTTSLNGIDGTWSPVLDNLNTTTYEFTPTAGQCADSASLTIVVNSIITPTFTQVAPICSGTTLSALPTTSNNGVVGTWSPALNNTATALYTFTPTSSPCAVPTTMTIVVNPNVTPTFTQVAPICSGAPLAALPTTSTNGITGTWSPAINNTATTLYTFTPTAGLCATNATMTITVNSNVTPTFTQVAPICSGGNLSALPTTSINGIAGTWSPALNNTATTLYTFTPSAGQCATNATMTIVVNPNVTPTFTQVSPICAGTALSALPTTSNNGITGFWSPALNNNATTTYTFAPTAGQCAINSTMTITVNPIPNVSAGSYPAICVDAADVALAGTPAGGTFSGNGVTGSNFDPSAGTSTITYSFTSPQGCSNTANATITVNPLPTIQAGVDQSVCVGTPVTLNGSGGIAYVWTNAVTNGSPFSPGVGSVTYTVTGTDVNGCVNQDQVVVNVLLVPTAVLSSDVTSGETPLVVNFTNASTNATNYVWDFGNGQGQTISNLNGTNTTYTIAGTYNVTLTASNGICSNVDNLTIIAIQPAPPIVKIPNVFSPNGDGINDKFFFELENIESINVVFFNRWGEVVYQLNSLLDAWDGRLSNGAEATEGVYFFNYEFKGLDGSIVSGHDFVTIIK